MPVDKPQPSQLVLASASPRRRELLQRLGLKFEVCPADIVECESNAKGPACMVLKNAALKAQALALRCADSLVLGSDTTVALGDATLGKPTGLDAARATLKRLSGREHSVYTAVSLRWQNAGFVVEFVERSDVRFKVLDDATISRYFGIVNPLDKAGAYGIQQGRELIIESVNGSVENIMGLPIQALKCHLAEHGFDFRH